MTPSQPRGSKKEDSTMRFPRYVPPVLLAAGRPLGALRAPRVLAGDRTTRSTEKMRQMYDTVRKIEIDTTRAVPVENFVIDRDITKITLASGKIWLTKPWREGQKPIG